MISLSLLSSFWRNRFKTMGHVDSWWLLPRLVSWWPALQLVSDDPSTFVQLTTQRNWCIHNVLTEIIEHGAGGVAIVDERWQIGERFQLCQKVIVPKAQIGQLGAAPPAGQFVNQRIAQHSPHQTFSRPHGKCQHSLQPLKDKTCGTPPPVPQTSLKSNIGEIFLPVVLPLIVHTWCRLWQ